MIVDKLNLKIDKYDKSYQILVCVALVSWLTLRATGQERYFLDRRT